jgi:hypothetical protein
MENKGLKGFWEDFNKTMNGLGKALDEELDKLKKTADEVRSNLNGAVSMSNTNGDIVIAGDVKSLTVNGEKIELKKKQ